MLHKIWQWEIREIIDVELKWYTHTSPSQVSYGILTKLQETRLYLQNATWLQICHIYVKNLASVQ